MTTTGIEPIAAGQTAAQLAGLKSTSSGNSFSHWLAQEIVTVNQQIHTAETNVQELAVGESDNLHQIMMSISKAQLQFELVVQVRNKILEGYQEVMRMQV